MMSNEDSNQTVLGALLKEFRSGSQSTQVDKRPSLYVAPTLSQLAPTSVTKRTYSEISVTATESATTSKRTKGEDESSCDSTPKGNKSGALQPVDCSPWEFRRLRGDLVAAKAEIAALERQMRGLHRLREVADIAFKKETDMLYEQLERERDKTRSLEKHNQELRARESESRAELDDVKQEFVAVRSKLERQVLEYRKENTNLKDKMMEVERSCEHKLRESRSQFEEVEMHLHYAKKQLESLTSSLKERDATIGKLVEEARVREQKCRLLEGADLRVQKLERELQEVAGAKEEVLSKQEKLRNYLSMEEDNRTLRAKNKELHELLYGKLLLEEQVTSLRDQLQGVDEMECNAARLAQENQRLRGLLDACKELVADPGQADPPAPQGGPEYDAVPSLLRRRLQALWDKHKAAVEEKLDTVNNWRESERQVDRLTEELEKANKQLEKLQGVHDQQTSLIRRLQKKLLLISRERDSYRQQLDLFERDLTIVPQTSEQKETASRIESQERTISMYRDMLEKLEEELNQLQSNEAGTWKERLRKAEAERDAVAADRDKQLKRRREVESQLDSWAERAYRGDERPRLLTVGLKENPVRWSVARRAAEQKELQAEVKKLRARVRLLMLGDQEVTRDIEDQQQVEKELEELRNEVKSNNVKMMRLKEAFRNTSHEYREAIHMLMGYTVDRTGHQQYKLISVYAESPSDYLLFKLNTKGSLDLLETPFSRTLKDMIDFHLKEQASIPMFLSGLTANLFHKQSINNSTVDRDTMSICSMAE